MNRTKERARRINALERELTKLLKQNQNKLNEYVQAFLSVSLDYDDGSFVDSIANLSAVSALNRVWDQFKDIELPEFISAFRSGLDDVLEYNKRYFEQWNIRDLDKIEDKAFRKQLRLVGFNRNNELYPGGYLDNILNSSTTINEIKSEVSRLALSESTRESASNRIKEVITGNPNKNGILEDNYGIIVNDTYNQFDRQLTKTVADSQGYEFYRYEGSVISTTRPFCASRAGKIFHKSQIEKWKNMSWAGKSSPYDPYRDVGGYNCRHQLHPMPTEYALKIKPELKKYL